MGKSTYPQYSLEILVGVAIAPDSKDEDNNGYQVKLNIDEGVWGHAVTVGPTRTKLEALAKAQIEAITALNNWFAVQIHEAAKVIPDNTTISKDVIDYIETQTRRSQEDILATVRRMLEG